MKHTAATDMLKFHLASLTDLPTILCEVRPEELVASSSGRILLARPAEWIVGSPRGMHRLHTRRSAENNVRQD